MRYPADSPQYTDTVVNYLTELASRTHAVGGCVAANNTYYSEDVAGFKRIIDSVDIDADETGFTEHVDDTATINPDGETENSTAEQVCAPKPWSKYLDGNWLTRTNALLYATQNPNKALEIIDKPCYYNEQIKSSMLDWPLANYLLIKYDRTYLSIEGEKPDVAYVDFPQLYAPIGAPIEDMQTNATNSLYWRHFEGALAIVNPSSKNSATFDLQNGRWVGIDQQVRSGVITLQPASALFLVPAYLSATWISRNGQMTTTANGDSLFIESKDQSKAKHLVEQVLQQDPTAAWKMSVEFHPHGRNVARIYLSGVGDKPKDEMIAVSCDMSSSSDSTKTWSTGGQTDSVSIEPLADGWYRCTIGGIPSKIPNTPMKVAIELSTVQSPDYLGNGKSGIEMRNILLLRNP